METANNTIGIEEGRKRAFRWVRFLVVPTLINLASLILFPMFVTDALTPPLSVICGVPILWGAYMLFSFRGRPERVVAYLATAMATVWAAAIVDLLTSYGWHWYF